MDFSNRLTQHRANGQHPAAPPHQPVQGAPVGSGNDKKNGGPSNKRGRWIKLGLLTLLYGGTILVVAILLFLNFGSPSQEGKFVNKDEMQAVFVNVNGTNGGQVYFGHIKDLNSQFIRLQNVFYIQNQASADAKTAAGSAYNLVKLGCELHGPEDEMIINRSEVFFWENLKASSQVAQKANEYYKNNPNGQQDCSKSNASASTSQATPQSQNTSPTTGSTSTTPTTDSDKSADTTKKQ